MKLIENTKFETITSDLAALENEYRLESRLEIYSCKSGTTTERKAFKSFVAAASPSAPDKDKEWLSPPDCVFNSGTSPVSNGSLSDTGGTSAPSGGILCDTIPKKTFWYLMATLNASYGIDADFSDVKSQMFSREPSVQWVMDRINMNFTLVLGGDFDRIRPYIWKAVDEAVVLRDCTVYSFSPDISYDPYAQEHNLWKFWYFFHNPGLKRVCFFQCRAVKNGMGSTMEPEMEGYFNSEDNETARFQAPVSTY
ncbi:repressor of RNA polymerase III transcription MAF1 homolog [Paramacrobiotus metropolitanus]|uniref:repressor of RNA polymerase III transcription MAF1 homolog n=1 Tax=Paramacrobiotus metropolitanus TaxID=2943436 RepID=UPI0024460824|nr:repressor of RNA polymerase III transcription MAF1 homolog [Paramacrobiotus metropolitanus]